MDIFRNFIILEMTFKNPYGILGKTWNWINSKIVNDDILFDVLHAKIHQNQNKSGYKSCYAASIIQTHTYVYRFISSLFNVCTPINPKPYIHKLHSLCHGWLFESIIWLSGIKYEFVSYSRPTWCQYIQLFSNEYRVVRWMAVHAVATTLSNSQQKFRSSKWNSQEYIHRHYMIMAWFGLNY